MHAPENSHWYSRTGGCVFSVPSADGKKLINPTIVHARKLGLVPGFTSISKVLYSFGLERYKIRQAILAALTLPRHDGESDDAYMARLDEDRQAHAKGRANEGTEIHGAIQCALEGREYDDRWHPHVRGVLELLETLPESFLGDFKTTESILDKEAKWSGKDKSACLFYDEHVMQLAAYARGVYSGNASRTPTDADIGKYICELSFAHPYGYGGKVDVLRMGRTAGEWPLVSIIISVKEPGLVRHRVWGQDDIKRGITIFDHALGVWQAKNRYDSSWR